MEMWLWNISWLEKSSNLDISQLAGRFQPFGFFQKIFFSNRRGGGVRRPLQHPVNDALSVTGHTFARTPRTQCAQ